MQRPARVIGIQLAISSSRAHASGAERRASVYVHATLPWLGAIRAIRAAVRCVEGHVERRFSTGLRSACHSELRERGSRAAINGRPRRSHLRLPVCCGF